MHIQMEYYAIILSLLLVFIIPHFLLSRFSKSKLPPGPKPWPIIGNIHQLGNKPHRSASKLSQVYGPIMSLKLGNITTIVISSPEVAKELFLKHDLAISSRFVPDAATAVNHHKHGLAWIPVCPKWRDLRRIATVQLFSGQQLDASQVLRQNKVNELVEYVRQCCDSCLPVDIGKAGFTTSLNLLSNTFFSMDLASHVSSYSQEFRDLAWHMLEEGARPNVSDFFPLLKPFDLQGVLRRNKRYLHKMMGIFKEIIDARLGDPMASKDDFLGILLKLVEDKELSLDDVKHTLVDLFIAGTESTSSTLEWAMTELLRNPEKMAKAQIEIERILGKEGLMQESTLSKLPYIHAVVKETLRLHPPVPFLVPHKAELDIQVCGYLIPKNSTLWVNLWSIGRNTSFWPNPKLFLPERFLEGDMDVKGQDFKFIPFGSGRRICPGIPLAYRMVHLMLVSLLHSFNWKFGDEIGLEDIDVEEKFGITLRKVHPLQAIPLFK